MVLRILGFNCGLLRLSAPSLWVVVSRFQGVRDCGWLIFAFG